MVKFGSVNLDFPDEDSVSEDILEFVEDENGKWIDSGVNAPTYNEKVYEMFGNVGHQWYQIMNRNRNKPTTSSTGNVLDIRL